MKNLLTITLSVVIISSSITASYSQSQAELNAIAEESLNDSDKDLNVVYKALMSDGTRSQDFKNDLREAQRSWVSFVDNHMKTVFPLEKDANPREIYGSSYATEYALEKLELVGARVAQLKRLNGEDTQVDMPKYQEKPQAPENVTDETLGLPGEPDIRVVSGILQQIVKYNPEVVDKILRSSDLSNGFAVKMVENEVTNLVVRNKYSRNFQDEVVFVYDLSFKPVTVAMGDIRMASSEKTLVLALVKRGTRWYQVKVPE